MYLLDFIRLYRWRKRLVQGQLIFVKNNRFEAIAFFDFYLLNGFAHIVYNDHYDEDRVDDYVRLTQIYPV